MYHYAYVQKARIAEKPFCFNRFRSSMRENVLERAAGIEPACTAWEAVVLPLNYARLLAEHRKGRRLPQGREP
jgi:hypothetical protein